ncbi:MAG: hypothetical protein E7327_08870 [Clostridiales bacterium]|nr:hypothetical protein [Clostridiales bacterium]
MNLLEELAAHLEWCGFGTLADEETDGDIQWARMPDSPDDCTCVYSTDSGVGGPDSTARIQIMTRAKSPRKAYELSCAIAEELDGFNGFLHGDGRGVIIEVINAATGLGPDTKKREIYVTNVAVRYCN